jgi:nitrate reductase alpha subunit
VIAPEYGPPSTKADYWIPIRPATDAALWLGVTKLLIDRKAYDEDFILRFTDFPLLVRTDTLKRLRAAEVFAAYKSSLAADGASMSLQGLTKEQHEKLGHCVVWDAAANAPKALTRDQVGAQMNFKPALDGSWEVRLADGKTVRAATLWNLYQTHLRDYDLNTVCEITNAPRHLIELLAQDMATLKPVAIHQGEGINHWFHATEMNRASYLPLMLTGNIGKPGTGSQPGRVTTKQRSSRDRPPPDRASKAGWPKTPSSLPWTPPRLARASTRMPTRRMKSRPTGITATWPWW